MIQIRNTFEGGSHLIHTEIQKLIHKKEQIESLINTSEKDIQYLQHKFEFTSQKQIELKQMKQKSHIQSKQLLKMRRKLQKRQLQIAEAVFAIQSQEYKFQNLGKKLIGYFQSAMSFQKGQQEVALMMMELERQTQQFGKYSLRKIMIQWMKINQISASIEYQELITKICNAKYEFKEYIASYIMEMRQSVDSCKIKDKYRQIRSILEDLLARKDHKQNRENTEEILSQISYSKKNIPIQKIKLSKLRLEESQIIKSIANQEGYERSNSSQYLKKQNEFNELRQESSHLQKMAQAQQSYRGQLVQLKKAIRYFQNKSQNNICLVQQNCENQSQLKIAKRQQFESPLPNHKIHLSTSKLMKKMILSPRNETSNIIYRSNSSKKMLSSSFMPWK